TNKASCCITSAGAVQISGISYCRQGFSWTAMTACLWWTRLTSAFRYSDISEWVSRRKEDSREILLPRLRLAGLLWFLTGADDFGRARRARPVLLQHISGQGRVLGCLPILSRAPLWRREEYAALDTNTFCTNLQSL